MTFACKVTNRLINNTLEHLNEYDIRKAGQHGIQIRLFMLTNLLQFFKKVDVRIDERKPVAVAYVDFVKTFDKVPHVRLATKLQGHYWH